MALLRNFVTVGSATAVSRVLGFVRDMLMAAALGTGPVADAFFVAFRFPNLFRRLFAEGAFNAAFVPLFGRALEEGGDEAAHRFGSEALSALLTVLLILTAVAEIAMPLLMYVLAPGFADDPAKFDLTVLLTRIAFPYLALVSVLALFSGALNAHGKFAAAAFAPALLNVVFIAALILIFVTGYAETDNAGVVLAWATLLGGVAQLALVIWAARRIGMNLRLIRPRLTPGVRRLFRLVVPGALAGGITQINIVVGTIIASMAPGAVSYLYYADRVYQLPLGIVGIAIGIVLLPDLTRQLRSGRDDLATHTQNRSLEFAMALTLPAAIALVVLAHPIIAVLFQRGAFTVGRQRPDRGGADRLRRRPSRLRPHQGAAAGLLRARGHQDADVVRGDLNGRQYRRLAGAVRQPRTCRHRHRHVERRLGQRGASRLGAMARGAILTIDEAARRRLPLIGLAAVLMGVVLYFGIDLFQSWLDDPGDPGARRRPWRDRRDRHPPLCGLRPAHRCGRFPQGFEATAQWRDLRDICPAGRSVLIALLGAFAATLSACSPTPDLPSLADVQAMFPDEALTLQVLPPPARYAEAALALEAGRQDRGGPRFAGQCAQHLQRRRRLLLYRPLPFLPDHDLHRIYRRYADGAARA